jgi:hypothetical protein
MPINPPSSSQSLVAEFEKDDELSHPSLWARDQPSSKGRVTGSELASVLRCKHSFACGGGCYAALPLRALLLLPCHGVNARAARKLTWAD